MSCLRAAVNALRMTLGQSLLELKGRRGEAEAQEPGLAVALHADPLGQFSCFFRVTPENEVFRVFRRGRCLALGGRGRTRLLSRIDPGTGQQEDYQSHQEQSGAAPFQGVDETRKERAIRVATLKKASADRDDNHVLSRRLPLSKWRSPQRPAAVEPAQARLVLSVPEGCPASIAQRFLTCRQHLSLARRCAICYQGHVTRRASITFLGVQRKRGLSNVRLPPAQRAGSGASNFKDTQARKELPMPKYGA